MGRILQILGQRLDRPTALAAEQRAASLHRELLYHFGRSTDRTEPLTLWTTKRAETLCDLLAFYQVVIVPASGTAWGHRSSALGRQHPIRFGAFVVNSAQIRGVNRAVEAFLVMTHRSGLPTNWLGARDGFDLLVRIRRTLAENE